MLKTIFTPRTRQWTQSLILLIMGLYLLDNMISGRIYYYINDRFGWLSWLATGILIVLGVNNVWDLLRLRAQNADAQNPMIALTRTGHTHGKPLSWPLIGVMAFPLLLGLIVPAKPLGAAAVSNSGISTSYANSQNATQLAISPTDRNVLDWVRVFNNVSNIDEVVGQPADLVGFVYRDIRFKDKPLFMTARFTVSCCVADASALGVIVQTTDAEKLSQDSWVHVKGKFQVQDLDGQRTPILVAETIESTTQPDHPYLYP